MRGSLPNDFFAFEVPINPHSFGDFQNCIHFHINFRTDVARILFDCETGNHARLFCDMSGAKKTGNINLDFRIRQIEEKLISAVDILQTSAFGLSDDFWLNVSSQKVFT